MYDLLLTGATGLLGHYVLAELLCRRTARCRVLLRPPLATSRGRLAGLLAELGVDLDAMISDGRVVAIEGSLPDHVEAASLRGVRQIVHAAGNTAFRPDTRGEPYRTNVEGTRALLALADEIGVERFLLVSTAYVCGRQTGRIPQRVLPQMPQSRNAYERSKWHAEQVVWAWRSSGKVATICRPSIVMGDRATGRATTMTGLYLVARATELLARAVADDPQADPHHVPLRILGWPDATANAIPVCWAARRIASIVLNPAEQGRVHHLTNPNPPTLAEIKSWLEDYFDICGGSFADPSRPLKNPNHFEDVFYSLGNIVVDYFHQNLRFESEEGDGEPHGPPLVDRCYFFRCMRYAQAVNWMRTRPNGKRMIPQDVTVDPAWYFERFLPDVLPRSQVARIEALTTVVRFVVAGPRGGQWLCRFDRGRLAELHRGSDGCVEQFGYRITCEAFQGIVTGRKPLQEAFFEGQAEMFGSPLEALKMVPIMAGFVKEFPIATEQLAARS